ncbi:uncharacterized protein BO66DRAFT_462574 [Aspergillus aculeatinus CBS 121060]|uniref:Uncharacterized protein n=1 Tax=Aspergillus aculeatinus CBS 121060 TaxID=1448322 RepID=A0ACD1GV64_9EURO|nr:hypothetical protein BO66DRAFT_462574 [Aspergillus aculeatinus CBS 121060]RAH65262.1 hypothetical protein BO66DRAFT_462574 [Aspergillus aculeatinus CBS 121060]
MPLPSNSSSSTKASRSRPLHTDWNTNPEFFRYTRGRFIVNEAHEMAIRHVPFNMNELAKRAAESVGSTPTECARVEKFPDGMFNKAFLFTMQDGTQVVGKIPNPNAGRAHHTTASEVATMDFVRNHLETPVPRVLDWSSKANENPIWPSLDIRDRFEVAKSTSKYQRAWMSASFTQYGRHRFAVGPSTGNSVEQYKLAVGHREIACVQNMAQLPQPPLALYGPGTYRPSRAKKIAALYLRVVKYLLPLDNSISSAFLWHPDLHSENIFVHPERPSEVTAIIDWQPYFLDYDGPSVTGLDPPTFPENFDQLDPAEQAAAKRLYLNMSLTALHRRFTCAKNERLFRAMEFRQTPSFEMMLLAQNILVDGEALYQARMLELEEEWPTLPGVQAAGNPPLPFQFSAGEALNAMELMRSLRQSMGELWPEKGVVAPGQYDQVKTLLNQAKAEIVGPLALSEEDRIAWEESWPYHG